MKSRLATINQLKVLGFIKGFIREHSYSPTVREISDHFSVTSKASQDVLIALRKKGYIRSVPHKSRIITIIREV